MKPLTISDLYKLMQKEMKAGHGDYVVFVTDDEEANGYHALWYAGLTAEEMGAEIELYEQRNCDLSCVKDDAKKSYYIG